MHLIISIHYFVLGMYFDVFPKIFRLNSEEVTVDWRKLHNEELHNLYRHQILFR
jgi:hypothetical protein